MAVERVDLFGELAVDDAGLAGEGVEVRLERGVLALELRERAWFGTSAKHRVELHGAAGVGHRPHGGNRGVLRAVHVSVARAVEDGVRARGRVGGARRAPGVTRPARGAVERVGVHGGDRLEADGDALLSAHAV